MLLPVLFFSVLVFTTIQIFSFILKEDANRIRHRFWFYKQHIELRSILRYSDTFFDDIPTLPSNDPLELFENSHDGLETRWFTTPIILFKNEQYIYALTEQTPYRAILRQKYTIDAEQLILHYIETLKPD